MQTSTVELATVPDHQRTARFRAVIVVIAPSFGFDPVSRVAGDSRHLAELSSIEKHQISHRGLAARQVIANLLSRG